MEERLDVIDYKTGKKTGEVVTRALAHQKGYAHKAVHLWVVIQHLGKAYFLFQQRSHQKPNYPGVFVASVGGHVMAGEGRETLLRESKEEIGISIDLSQVKFLESHPFELLLPNYIDYEWIDDYLYLAPETITDFTFEDGEVIGLGLLLQAELKALVVNPDTKIEGLFYDGKEVKKRQFSKADFIPDFSKMQIATTLCGLNL